MLRNLKTVQVGFITITLMLVACGDSFESNVNMTSKDFCIVYPNDPDCNGGSGGTGSQLVYSTPTSDGTIRMVHSNPNNPDFGEGYAKINLKNTSAQALIGSVSIDQNGNNFPITLLEICSRLNDSAITCSSTAGSQISLAIPSGATGYFLARVHADGTIPFAPFVNAIYVRLIASDIVQNSTLKIPIANVK